MNKFKTYDQNQTYLPLDLESLIPTSHLVRFINDTINKIDMTKRDLVTKGWNII
jgi:transposase